MAASRQPVTASAGSPSMSSPPARGGLPAEVRCQFTMRSTDGPLESVMIRCPAGLWITVMRPRHRRTTAPHPMATAVSGG